MHFLALLSNIIVVYMTIYVSGHEKEGVILRAARGREARLPCTTGKIYLDGPEAYIIWVKNDKEFLHRYPNPNPETRLATRDHVYRIPCESGNCDDTSLVIKKMSERDEGNYTCRIHYQASPSEDYVINLKLVESTGLPMIYTGDGEPLKLGFVGPLGLGFDLTLVCEAYTDDPRTEMLWHRNDELVEQESKSRSGRTLRREIHLQPLTRGDLNARYECLVQNADVSEPLVARVIIRMYLPPMSVEIRMDEKYDFEVGQPRVIDCVVVGSMPPPAVSWNLGSKMLRPSVHKELRDGNYTVSSLTLAPSLSDHRNELVCRAHNPYTSNELFQDKVTINVGYRPNCLLDREERIGAVTHETESVRCVVDSYPEPVQFSWTFPDSKTIYTIFTKVEGYPNRYTSTLTWLSRDADIGILHCRATNVFGDQKKSCKFNITVGGPPELPKCNVRRIYPNSLEVRCLKGWDGGRPQMVHLDIVDENGAHILKVGNKTGQFNLANIVDKVNMTAVVYASNARGRSKEKVIYLHTLPANSEADNNYIHSDWMTWMTYIKSFGGVVVMTIFGTIMTIGARILLARDDRDNESDNSDEDNLDIVPLPDDTPDNYIININLNVPSSTFPLPPGTLLQAQGTLHPEPISSNQRIYYV